MKKHLLWVGMIGLLAQFGVAEAATDWSAQDYDLYPGDFNGDGKTDILYVAKDPAKPSGIATSDGTAPNIAWQTWPSNYLNIPWANNRYNIIVADFNGDGKADIFLQSTVPGDNYLLLTDSAGHVVGISQTISNTALGLVWSTDQHAIMAGDFNGDGKADLFLQATSPSGTNAVIYADTNGLFTQSPTQTWTDGYLGLNWSTQEANVFVGDFDGIVAYTGSFSKADLLVQAKPKFVQIAVDDIAIPVPTYPPNMNGVAFSQGGVSPFQLANAQTWSRNDKGVDWSPLSNSLTIGDFNGDGKADVLLQARYAGQTSYLLNGNATGAIFSSAPTALSVNIGITSDNAKLIAANFDGMTSNFGVTWGDGLYVQALTPNGTNYTTNGVAATTVTATHNPSTAMSIVPASAVGRTNGNFQVSNSGAATYSIPIVVPPGIAGVQPSLAITYSSGGGNGPLGMGWNLSGLSQIYRCPKDLSRDGINDGYNFSNSDVFCLDGNRLRLTSGVYGQAGSTYQTELETFSRITVPSVMSGGFGPTSFTVEGKDGLKYEYGSSSDSRILTTFTVLYPSTARVWALNKVSDRNGNTMTISYQPTSKGGFVPSEINYTSNANANVVPAYKVKFVWESRPQNEYIISYVAGGSVYLDLRLNHIETQYNDPALGAYRLVRKYQLTYDPTGSTGRSRLLAVQECDGNGLCLSPTMFGWRNGDKGLSDQFDAQNVGALTNYAFPMDVDGDGIPDLVYPKDVGSGLKHWMIMYGVPTSIGSSPAYGTPIDVYTEASSSDYTTAIPIDYNSDGRGDLLIVRNGYWNVLLGKSHNGGIKQLDHLGEGGVDIPATGAGSNVWVIDYDGDGRQDLVFMDSASPGSIFARRNTGNGFSTTITTLYTLPAGYTFRSLPFGSAQSVYRSLITVADFNADGRPDIVVGVSNPGIPTTFAIMLMSTGATGYYQGPLDLQTTADPNQSLALLRAADVNGDGIVDVIHPCTSTSWCVWIGRGTSNGALVGPLNTTVAYSSSTLNAVVMDWDGDGHADFLVAQSQGNWQLYKSTGNIVGSVYNIPQNSGPITENLFGTGQDTGIPATGAASAVVVDLNGDGLTDLLYPDSSNVWHYRLHKGVVPDYVTSVDDGFGNVVNINYEPLSRGTSWITGLPLYTKGTTAAFPEVDIQPNTNVVSQYTSTSGLGSDPTNIYSVREFYSGARVHLQGRGFEGFASRSETDSRNLIKITSVFDQDRPFPFTGTVKSVTTTQPNGKTISSTTTGYSEIQTSTTQYNDRHYLYISNSTQASYEVSATDATVDGALIKTTSSNVDSIDSYGNVLVSTTTNIDQTGSNQVFTSTTTNSITNDTANWCLGLLTQVVTTSSAPNVSPLFGNVAPTRTVAYERDPDLSKCRAYKQTIEPTNSNKVVTTSVFDSFGHTKQTTVTGTNISRVSVVDYGSQGVFPVQFTNANTVVSYKTYDYALGVPLTATDPNGMQVVWKYDGFGRKYREEAPDGTVTLWTLLPCNLSNGYCGDSLLRSKLQVQQLDGSSSHNVVRTDYQFFDQTGRNLYSQTQTLSGAYSVVKSVYNNFGQLTKRSTPYYSGFTPNYTTNYYDLVGRLVKTERQASDSDSTLQTIQYSYSKLTQSVTDPLNHTSTKTSNALGQVVQVTDGTGSNTYFQYDALGDLTKTTDSSGNQITAEFDVLGFKRASNDPDMGRWTYSYYPTGELQTQTDAKGQSVTYTYDNTSRPLTRTEQEGVTTWTYGSSATEHNIGRLYTVTSPGGYGEEYHYDNLGRPSYIKYTEDTTYQVDYSYNSLGTVDVVTYPANVGNNRLQIQYQYTNGQVSKIRNVQSGTQYWTLNSTNAADQPIDESMSNGLHVITGFDSINGSIGYRQSGNNGSTSNLQNLSYEWDKAGNLTKRQDTLQNLTETFFYDKSDGSFNLYRLDHSTLKVGSAATTTNFSATYNPIGNVVTKADPTASGSTTDTKTFDYTTAQTGCSYYNAAQPYSYSQPHAVRAVTHSDNSKDVFCYDANGNMTSRAGSSIQWTSYNLPSQINSGANNSQFSYGANRQRWRQVANYNGTLETTVYIAGMVEKVTRNGVTEYKHYIAGGSATAIYTVRTDGSSSTFFVTSDHLGSADVITDGTGAAVVRESFAAFGARRGSNWSGAPSVADQAQFTSTTRHGYTGHEELDNLNLIHMNGRVYDPTLGRFISADPYIQAPMNQQSLNRYSYVTNGPMSATDPSGYWQLKQFLNPFSKDNPIGAFSTVGKIIATQAAGLLPYADYQIGKANDRFWIDHPDAQFLPIVAGYAVDAYFGTFGTGAAIEAHFARINGAPPRDVLRGFVVSLATSYAFNYVGGSSAFNAAEHPIMNVFAHAAIGCASAAANGGSCKNGALSGAFGAAYSNLTSGIPELNSNVGGFLGAAISGGIGSELGGGEFWDGAKMAGLGYLFNQLGHTYSYSITINSNAYVDDSPGRGHVWITVKDLNSGKTTLYGLYPDFNSDGVRLREDSDVYVMNPDDYTRVIRSYTVKLTWWGYKNLMTFINTPATYSSSYVCANWAVDAMKTTTGVSWLSAHEWGYPFGTPRAVTQSIRDHENPK